MARSAGAQSYLYVQGDKSIPFYVKVNGVMQERYGKNYCIAANLAPGKATIEILFQQNAYPAETFTIDIPANGQLGLMLSKDGSTYKLYDIATRKTINPEPPEKENK